MDGTLTNSEPLWAEATFYLSENLGRRLTPTERLATVGATFERTLQTVSYTHLTLPTICSV